MRFKDPMKFHTRHGLRVLLAGAGLLIGTALAAVPDARAEAVDCGGRVLSDDEFTICRFERLRALDREVDDLYRQLLRAARPGSPRQRNLVRSQRRFVLSRRACRDRVQCIARRYEIRIRRLEVWLADASLLRRRGPRAGDGIRLGSVELDDRPLRLTLPVGTSRGKFSGLRLHVRQADSFLNRVIVEFANGGRDVIEVGSRIERGGSTGFLPLRGGRLGRHIARVEILGRVVQRGYNDAEVDVIGVPADAAGGAFARRYERDWAGPGDGPAGGQYRDERADDDYRDGGDRYDDRYSEDAAPGEDELAEPYRDEPRGDYDGREPPLDRGDTYEDERNARGAPRPPAIDRPPPVTRDEGDDLGERRADVEPGYREGRDRRAEVGEADEPEARGSRDRPRTGRNRVDQAEGGVDERIEAFVTGQFHRTTEMGPEELRGVYADRVDYYGEDGKLVEEIIADKKNYGSRWPVRQFTVRDGTLEVADGDAPGVFTVTYEYDFLVRSDERESKGIGRSELKLREVDGGFQILSEQGRIVKRL